MGGKVILLYKRRQLLLRDDQPPETPELNAAPDYENLEQTAANKLQNIAEACKCENCGAQYDGYQSELTLEIQKLCSACTKLQDSATSDHTEKPGGLEETSQSAKSDPTQMTFQQEILMEESCGKQECQMDSAGLEDEDKCQETFSMLPPSDAGSNMSSDLTDLKMSDGTSSNHEREGGALSGKFTSGDANQLLKDKYFSACNNIGAKRKLTSTLDTFSQRCKSKPNLNITAAQETTSAHADNSDKSEKPSPSVDLVTNGTEQEVDDQLHFPNKTAQNAPSATVLSFQDSEKETSLVEGQFSEDVQQIHHGNQLNVQSQSLPNDNQNTSEKHSDVSGKRDLLASQDLSVSPSASRDIGCNLLPVYGSDEIHLTGPSEVLHFSLDSTNKLKENMPNPPQKRDEDGSRAKAVCDKGQYLIDPTPLLIGASPRNNCLHQLFPHGRSNNMPSIANNLPELGGFMVSEEWRSKVIPASMESLHVDGLSPQPGQIFHGHASYSPMYAWPNFHVPSREPFQDFLQHSSGQAPPSSRHNMMLELTTTWSEMELDSLWIGIRRHGRGNWDAMLKDQKLRFMPWKTPMDLAQRWGKETLHYLSRTPVSQVNYGSPPVFSSDSAANLLHSQVKGPTDIKLAQGGEYSFYAYPQKRPAVNFMNQKSRPLQIPMTSSSYFSRGPSKPYAGNPMIPTQYSTDAGPMKGKMQHWLRETVSGVQWPNQGNFEQPENFQQPRMCTRDRSSVRKAGWQSSGKAGCINSTVVEPRECRSKRQAELIVISSDASSEETISDDHRR